MVWSDIAAGTDGGLIIGEDQQPNELVQAVGILGFRNYFNFTTAPQDATDCTSDASANVFDDVSCQGADCLGKTDLETLHMLWNRECFPVGSLAGCTNASCTPEQQSGIFVKDYYIDPIGGRWRLRYDQVVPNGTLQGTKFSVILGGLLPGGGAPAAGDAKLDIVSGTDVAWKPIVTDPNSDVLNCRLGVPPASGSATVASDCSTGTYAAPAGYVGSETFTYIASDGEFDSNPGTVTAMVSPVPTPLPTGAPIADDVSNPIFYGNGGSWEPRVSDPDNSPGPLTCRIAKLPMLGIAKVAEDCSIGSYSALDTPYGPPLGGYDSFTYIVSDGLYDSKPGSVSVSWTDDAPPPPDARDVSVDAESGQLISWKPVVFSVLPAGCGIAYAPSNGVATVAGDCSSGTYQSNPGFVGTDSFIYSATSGAPEPSAYAMVTVAVTEAPPSNACTAQHPVSQISQLSRKGALTITFTGNITTYTNKTVTVCPGTSLSYQATSTQGPVVCKVNNNTTLSSGTLEISDHIRCTDKPAGKGQVDFKVRE